MHTTFHPLGGAIIQSTTTPYLYSVLYYVPGTMHTVCACILCVLPQYTTADTVDVTTNSTVMLLFLHCVIPQYIVLAPTNTQKKADIPEPPGTWYLYSRSMGDNNSDSSV
jgi:hypothetical protein